MADLDQESLINKLIDGVSELLELKLKTEITDDAKAGVVRPGKLQDDPTLRKINILIHTGGEDWPDKLNQNFGPTAGIFSNFSRSLGGEYGSAMWRRYIVVEFEIFFPNSNSRTDARMKANLVMSRARNAIHKWIPGRAIAPDSFGESVQAVQPVQHWLREGGGTGDFNWRGEMVVEFLTELEPTDD